MTSAWLHANRHLWRWGHRVFSFYLCHNWFLNNWLPVGLVTMNKLHTNRLPLATQTSKLSLGPSGSHLNLPAPLVSHAYEMLPQPLVMVFHHWKHVLLSPFPISFYVHSHSYFLPFLIMFMYVVWTAQLVHCKMSNFISVLVSALLCTISFDNSLMLWSMSLISPSKIKALSRQNYVFFFFNHSTTQ